MTTVFVNYRTHDEENVAGLLEYALSKRFRSEVFFRASKSITPGDDFEAGLLDGVRTSSALLAVIGARWLEVCDDDGGRKIDKESDWVRREILEALRLGIRVVPVLVGDARPLPKEDLPAELAPLASCQYVRLRSRDLEADLDRIALMLTELVPELREEKVVTPGTGSVTNNASGNARVGLQARDIVGDISFGGFLNDGDRGGR